MVAEYDEMDHDKSQKRRKFYQGAKLNPDAGLAASRDPIETSESADLRSWPMDQVAYMRTFLGRLRLDSRSFNK